MDRACKNCRFCICAHSMRGKEEPYCEWHSKWIGNTLLCSEWEAVIVPKPVTNYDRIVGKSPEELAVFQSDRGGCQPNDRAQNITGCKAWTTPTDKIDETCRACWLEYLKREAKE